MPSAPISVDDESRCETDEQEQNSGISFCNRVVETDPCNAQSQRQLFDKHSRAIHSYVRRMVGNRDDADELFQEVALAALQHSRGPEDVEQYGAWCRGLARHILFHYYRTKRRRADLLAQIQWDGGSLLDNWSNDPEHRTAINEVLGQVFEGIDDRSRQIILCRHLYGESASEIAERMEQSPASVRMKLMRLRTAAKRCA